MFRLSFSDAVGIGGIALMCLLLALDKAGKVKGGLLYALIAIAGVMTLFIAIGNDWVMDAPTKWRIWRGALMLAVVALAYSGAAIWIYGDGNGQSEHGTAEKTDQPDDQSIIKVLVSYQSFKLPIKVPPLQTAYVFPVNAARNAAPAYDKRIPLYEIQNSSSDRDLFWPDADRIRRLP